MIKINEDNTIRIQIGSIQLILNPNEVTESDIRLIQAYHPDNSEQVIAHEIKMRDIHKQIIEKGQFSIIEQMIKDDPNGWFIEYCNLNGIQL